jgi:pimeloyl-ACP methyl ester carboxylesterase
VDGSPDLIDALEAQHIRLVLVSRPGFGTSDPDPTRTLRSFARDLDQAADALRLDRFALLGVSAGGPYAIAAAHELGDRVTTTSVVSSLAPTCPKPSLRALLACVDGRGDWQPTRGPRTNVRAFAQDRRLTTGPWGFDLRDVSARVHVWHGMQDPLVPVEHALQLTLALARCDVHLEPAEGHFFFRRRAREILQETRMCCTTRGVAARS